MEGSTSQQWCTNYYRKLPDAVSSKIIGVKTTDTESGSQWLVVSNIDGTKTDKDKVFFLSGKEYLEHTEAADHSKGTTGYCVLRDRIAVFMRITSVLLVMDRFTIFPSNTSWRHGRHSTFACRTMFA